MAQRFDEVTDEDYAYEYTEFGDIPPRWTPRIKGLVIARLHAKGWGYTRIKEHTGFTKLERYYNFAESA